MEQIHCTVYMIQSVDEESVKGTFNKIDYISEENDNDEHMQDR